MTDLRTSKKDDERPTVRIPAAQVTHAALHAERLKRLAQSEARHASP